MYVIKISDFPDEFISDSIFLLRIQGSDAKMKTYRKIRYLDYIQYREDKEDSEDLLWADHNRWYFVNPNAWDNVSGRTLEIWGFLRASQFTSSTAILPFSPNSDDEENSGNHAIIRLAYAYALESDKLDNSPKANTERTAAYQTLEILSKREEKAQADYEVYQRPGFEYKNLFPKR